MAVKIRLMMTGKRNDRSFRIVAVDESKKRDGAVIEILGSVANRKSAEAKLKTDRVAHWLKVGATLTSGAQKYVKV